MEIESQSNLGMHCATLGPFRSVESDAPHLSIS